VQYKCNYILGNDRSKWRVDVPNFKEISYKEIYPGIDLKYYGDNKSIEYDFIISPGADPNLITVHYDGAKSLDVTPAGELVVETDWGKVIERLPRIYQKTSAGPLDVKGRYALLGNNTFGFQLTEDYDRTLALVIDPTLNYSSYLSGTGEDNPYASTADNAGDVFITGSTTSSDFDITPSYDNSYNGSYDVYVTKISTVTHSLVYSTYIGGNGSEEGYDIHVDSVGNAFVTGVTSSNSFPKVNAFDSSFDGTSEAFVLKLAASGNSLVYSTYLGGSADEYGHGVTFDKTGNTYVVGSTSSADFPTLNAYDPTANGLNDVFIAKLNSTGNAIIYSTYIGGTDSDVGSDIEIDSAGNSYITGWTFSNDFPTANGFDLIYNGGSTDAYVAKLSASGNNLLYSTYLGGNGTDNANRIAVNKLGEALVVGATSSSAYPTANAYDPSFNGVFDIFVTRLDQSGLALSFSTFVGGSQNDQARDVALDGSGNIWFTGWTKSINIPLVAAYDSTINGGYDLFVGKMSANGSSLLFTSYLGGTGDDFGYGIALDAANNIYLGGQTFSSDFPQLNSLHGDNGNGDLVVVKLIEFICGDANADKKVNVSDAVYLISYIFAGGPEPSPHLAGDANCDNKVNVSDAVYLITYIFAGGPAPCANCK
jgi:hypothetical protein